MMDCVALDPTDLTDPTPSPATQAASPRKLDTGANQTALNYNNSLFDLSLTWVDEEEIIFSEPSMTPGSREGNGYAVITLMPEP